MSKLNTWFVWLLVIIVLFGTRSLLAASNAPIFVAVSAPSFSRPHDVTLDPSGRYLYVADVDNDVVKVLLPYSLKRLGVIGRGDLASPHDVAFDAAGRLLVADTGNDRIAIYRVNGVTAAYIGELRGDLHRPEGVATNTEGAIYVTNAWGHNIVKLVGAKRIATMGSRGRGSGQFIRPHDIEVGPDNLVYVADPGNNRIQLLDKGLSVVGQIQHNFSEPKYLALDEKGWLYVGDQHNHQVKIFDTDRKLIGIIGTGKAGRGRHELDRLEGVEARNGHIWIADTYNNRILLYTWPN